MVKVLLAALVVAGGLVALVAASWPSYAPPVAEAAIEPEKPWFSREALRQVVNLERGFGPLFEGSVVGRSAPSEATRARIAAFAKQHDVGLELEIRDGELRSVTLDITFGGCCGYEGVDVMAMGLARPSVSEACGDPGSFIDNWAVFTEDARIRATIRVNRLTLHWEPRITLPVLLARLDSLVGMRADAVAKSEGAHWKTVEDGRILLEQPFELVGGDRFGVGPGLAGRMDLGAEVRVANGVISELEFALYPSVDTDEVMAACQAQWGTPRIEDGARTWIKGDRVISTDRERHTILIKQR
jgi:hypothetical protein